MCLGRGGGGGKGDLTRLAARRAACLALRPTLIPSVGCRYLFEGLRVRSKAAANVVRVILLTCACSRALAEYIFHPLRARKTSVLASPALLPQTFAKARCVLAPITTLRARLRSLGLALHRSMAPPQAKAAEVSAIHLGVGSGRLLRRRAGLGGRVKGAGRLRCVGRGWRVDWLSTWGRENVREGAVVLRRKTYAGHLDMRRGLAWASKIANWYVVGRAVCSHCRRGCGDGGSGGGETVAGGGDGGSGGGEAIAGGGQKTYAGHLDMRRGLAWASKIAN